MGDYQHQAILVSANDVPDHFDEARKLAIELLGDRGNRVTEPAYAANGFVYFAIFPSGGKLGGSIEREVEAAREVWKARVVSLRINWVEVSWGEFDSIIRDERYPPALAISHQDAAQLIGRLRAIPSVDGYADLATDLDELEAYINQQRSE